MCPSYIRFGSAVFSSTWKQKFSAFKLVVSLIQVGEGELAQTLQQKQSNVDKANQNLEANDTWNS